MSSNKGNLLFVLFLFVYSIYVIAGTASVPFHPDESSLLYQSRDLEALTAPKSLAWVQDAENEYDQTYRLLNAPLAKYLIGLGRRAAGYTMDSVDVDWDWGLSWEENSQRGALPQPQLLLGGRLAMAIFLPISVGLIYIAGHALEGPRSGWIAALLLATNALVLLHGRRAMAEGVLLFGVCLAIAGVIFAHRHSWLDGLGIGLAISSKYSTFALFPVGLLAAAWGPDLNRKHILKNLGIFLLTSTVVVLLLHPILWDSPLEAGREMFRERQELLSTQVGAFEGQGTEHILSSPVMRIGAMIYTIYIGPPQFEEVGNYSSQLRENIEDYQSRIDQSLFRGPILGGALFFATILGIILYGISLRSRESRLEFRNFILVLLMTLSQAGALLIFNPLPFQRYYLPLIPYVCIWASLGISLSITRIKRAVQIKNGSTTQK